MLSVRKCIALTTFTPSRISLVDLCLFALAKISIRIELDPLRGNYVQVYTTVMFGDIKFLAAFTLTSEYFDEVCDLAKSHNIYDVVGSFRKFIGYSSKLFECNPKPLVNHISNINSLAYSLFEAQINMGTGDVDASDYSDFGDVRRVRRWKRFFS